MLTKSDHDFIKRLEKGEKKRKKREEKEFNEMQKKFEKGEKLRRKKDDEFINRIEKGEKKRQKRVLLKNASRVQRMKLRLRWALRGYHLKQDFDYTDA